MSRTHSPTERGVAPNAGLLGRLVMIERRPPPTDYLAVASCLKGGPDAGRENVKLACATQKNKNTLKVRPTKAAANRLLAAVNEG